MSGFKQIRQTNKKFFNDYLKKCFTSIIERRQLSLEIHKVRHMLYNSLEFNWCKLEGTLSQILPYFLIYRVNNWPGWAQSSLYYDGTLSFNDWYEEFVEYLKQKINEAVNMQYKNVFSESYNELISANKIGQKKTQTESMFLNQAELPLAISIRGKPELLNTMAFTSVNNDVILKPHASVEWQQISLKQIFAWPHVGVDVFSPILTFSRTNVHEFKRYVGQLEVNSFVPSNDIEFIESIEALNSKRSCFSKDFIEETMSFFLKALKETCVANVNLEIFEEIFKEILIDIEELQININGRPTIASNTAVQFNIGKAVYFRNKILCEAKKASSNVSFMEIIIPRVEMQLINVAKGYHSRSKFFDYLKKDKSLLYVTFTCNYCKVNFKYVTLLVRHFMDRHKIDPPMACGKCLKTFSVSELTLNRWTHE